MASHDDADAPYPGYRSDFDRKRSVAMMMRAYAARGKAIPPELAAELAEELYPKSLEEGHTRAMAEAARDGTGWTP